MPICLRKSNRCCKIENGKSKSALGVEMRRGLICYSDFGFFWLDGYGKGEIYIYSQNDTFAKFSAYFEQISQILL